MDNLKEKLKQLLAEAEAQETINDFVEEETFSEESVNESFDDLLKVLTGLREEKIEAEYKEENEVENDETDATTEENPKDENKGDGKTKAGVDHIDNDVETEEAQAGENKGANDALKEETVNAEYKEEHSEENVEKEAKTEEAQAGETKTETTPLKDGKDHINNDVETEKAQAGETRTEATPLKDGKDHIDNEVETEEVQAGENKTEQKPLKEETVNAEYKEEHTEENTEEEAKTEEAQAGETKTEATPLKAGADHIDNKVETEEAQAGENKDENTPLKDGNDHIDNEVETEEAQAGENKTEQKPLKEDDEFNISDEDFENLIEGYYLSEEDTLDLLESIETLTEDELHELLSLIGEDTMDYISENLTVYGFLDDEEMIQESEEELDISILEEFLNSTEDELEFIVEGLSIDELLTLENILDGNEPITEAAEKVNKASAAIATGAIGTGAYFAGKDILKKAAAAGATGVGGATGAIGAGALKKTAGQTVKKFFNAETGYKQIGNAAKRLVAGAPAIGKAAGRIGKNVGKFALSPGAILTGLGVAALANTKTGKNLRAKGKAMIQSKLGKDSARSMVKQYKKTDEFKATNRKAMRAKMKEIKKKSKEDVNNILSNTNLTHIERAKLAKERKERTQSLLSDTRKTRKTARKENLKVLKAAAKEKADKIRKDKFAAADLTHGGVFAKHKEKRKERAKKALENMNTDEAKTILSKIKANNVKHGLSEFIDYSEVFDILTLPLVESVSFDNIPFWALSESQVNEVNRTLDLDELSEDVVEYIKLVESLYAENNDDVYNNSDNLELEDSLLEDLEMLEDVYDLLMESDDLEILSLLEDETLEYITDLLFNEYDVSLIETETDVELLHELFGIRKKINDNVVTYKDVPSYLRKANKKDHMDDIIKYNKDNKSEYKEDLKALKIAHKDIKAQDKKDDIYKSTKQFIKDRVKDGKQDIKKKYKENKNLKKKEVEQAAIDFHKNILDAKKEEEKKEIELRNERVAKRNESLRLHTNEKNNKINLAKQEKLDKIKAANELKAAEAKKQEDQIKAANELKAAEAKKQEDRLNDKVASAKKLFESVDYISLSEAILLGGEYFTTESLLTESAEDKINRLQEQVALLIAKESNDPLFEEFVENTISSNNLRNHIIQKYSEISREKTGEIIGEEVISPEAKKDIEKVTNDVPNEKEDPKYDEAMAQAREDFENDKKNKK